MFENQAHWVLNPLSRAWQPSAMLPPVAIVTAVICLMSFYLIALVVWMGLYYRTPAVVPQELVRDVQELLDQTNYSDAFQRLVADPSFLARARQGCAEVTCRLVASPASYGASQRRCHDGNGTSDNLSGDGGDARTDDRPRRNRLWNDYRIPSDRARIVSTPSKPTRSWDFDSTLLNAGRYRDLDSRDLFLRHVPKSDRSPLARGGNDGRAALGPICPGSATGCYK